MNIETTGNALPHDADAFDIDWEAGDGRLLVPVVGDDDLDTDEGGTGRIHNLRLLAP